jgi:hypothetical protein
LAEVWPTLDAADQDVVRDAAPILVADVVSLSLNPEVFDQLGITGGAEAAVTNPRYRANIIEGLGKLTSFLADVGIIDQQDNRWSDLGLTIG